MKNIVLKLDNVSKSFKGKTVVKNISFEVCEGDIFGFLGPNGSGKTTTIRMILNLLKPDSGKIYICGYNNQKDFIKAIKNIGATIETPKFYPYLTGEENLNIMAKLSNLDSNKVIDTLNIVGLSENKDKKFCNYSLGMKQRLGIGNALLSSPKVIILDEPTNGLDPKGIKEIRDLIVNLSKEKNITFIISTHLLYEVEQICNKVAILNNGSIIKQDYVNNLINSEYEEIALHIDSKNETETILSSLDYVNSFKKVSYGFEVSILKDSSSKLILSLIKNNINIKYVIPIKKSLEDIYMSLTNKENLND